MLPGLLIYGTGLAIVLTVNDPVSLDTVPEPDQGQASGVSATAEQGGGAIGIALLYALFHTTYVTRLNTIIDADSSIPDLDNVSGPALKQALLDAEQPGCTLTSSTRRSGSTSSRHDPPPISDIR